MSLHDRLKAYYDRLAMFPEGGRCEHGVHLKRDAYVAFLDLRKLLEDEVFPLLHQMERAGQVEAPVAPSEPAPIKLGPCRVCGGDPVPSFYTGVVSAGFIVECANDKATGNGSHATGVHRSEREAAEEWNHSN